MKKMLFIAVFAIFAGAACQKQETNLINENEGIISLPKGYSIQVINASVEKNGKSYVKIKVKSEEFLITPSHLKDLTTFLKKCSANISISTENRDVIDGWGGSGSLCKTSWFSTTTTLLLLILCVPAYFLLKNFFKSRS